MWGKDAAVKEDGQKVLGNYKKQIAEKMARDQAEAGLIKSKTSWGSKSNVSGTQKFGKTASSTGKKEARI